MALGRYKNLGKIILIGRILFAQLTLCVKRRQYRRQFFSQIFFLVILFAAYNGLVFLPVLLSVAGPGQRRTEKPKSASRDVAMVEVNKKLNGDSVQKEEERETEVKERLLENGEAVA